jgi:heme/copper-type cytochrome/quinol oxidase subunit 3
MGRSLVIAGGWFQRRATHLAPNTRDFVSASLAADAARRAAESRQQRRVLAGTVIGLAIALVLSVLAGWKWYQAEAEAKETQVQRDRA